MKKLTRKKSKEQEMAKDGIGVVEALSSSEEGNPLRSILCLKRKDDIKLFEETEDCFILDFDPYESIDLSIKLSMAKIHDGDDQDVSITAEKGQVACRDYPHSRHLCVKFPFDETPHESYCEQCYCYVCDSSAPCKDWWGSQLGHCHATEEHWIWREHRSKGKEAVSRRSPLRGQSFSDVRPMHYPHQQQGQQFGHDRDFTYREPSRGPVISYQCGQEGHVAMDCHGSSGDPVVCYQCGQEGHVAVDCHGSTGDPVVCYQCGQEGHVAMDCRERSNSPVICYKCGWEGHVATNCRGLSRGPIVCYKCGREGHVATHCRGLSRGPVVCHKCGQEGHVATHCCGPSRGLVICYKCGQEGHVATHCRRLRSGPVVCYKCGQEGHVATHCRRSSIGPVICYKCGRMGHVATHCRGLSRGPVICYKCGREGHVATNCHGPSQGPSKGSEAILWSSVTFETGWE